MIVLHEHFMEGCFVFQVVRKDKVRLLNTPDLEEQNKSTIDEGHFESNELLSVDKIQPTTDATFVRLADQSGWVVAEEYGDLYLRQVPVEMGLFEFFVDFDGMIARHHPMDDSSDLLSTETGNCLVLHPMQKIFCDAVVKHPTTNVKFYRLQTPSNEAPAVPGWVFDRIRGEFKDEVDRILLLPPHMVQTGLFAYRALHGVAPRVRPTCTESSKTNQRVDVDEIVVGDILRSSPQPNGNGPFLRLSDGSGWLFVYKRQTHVLEYVPVLRGKWIVSVLNDPVGLKLRRQPVDCQDKVYEIAYEYGTVLECDAKVTNHIGVNFYRVIGTNGWLFDQRKGRPMLNVLSKDVTEKIDEIKLKPWSPDFVRGVAAAVSGTEEISYDEQLKLLTFDTKRGTGIKVFCISRTIGLIIAHPTKGTIKKFEHHCSPEFLHSAFLSDPPDTFSDSTEMDKISVAATTGMNYHHQDEKKEDISRSSGQTVGSNGQQSGAKKTEEKVRKELLACDAEISSIRARRRELIKQAKAFDQERSDEAFKAKTKMEIFMKLHGIAIDEMNQLSISPMHSMASSHHNNNNEDHNNINRLEQIYTSASGQGEIIEQKTKSSTRSPKIGVGSRLWHSSQQQHNHHTRNDNASVTNKSIKSTATNATKSGGPVLCGECFRKFSGKYSRDLHCREAHGLFCPKCDRIFPSSKDLENHQESQNHFTS